MTSGRPVTPRRGSGGRWTPADAWLAAAALCFLAGVIVLIVTWYKISGLALVAEQLPYFASGGLGGLALFIAGAGCLSAGRSARIEARLTELLSIATEPVAPTEAAAPTTIGGPIDAPASHPVTGLGRSSESKPSDATVLTVAGGTTYHRPHCRLVAGKETTALPLDDAAAQGLTPCPVCH